MKGRLTCIPTAVREMRRMTTTSPLWMHKSFVLLFPVGMLLLVFLIPGPFTSWGRPEGILCRRPVTLEIPPFGWSKQMQPDPTPGSGGRHICSFWLPANRGFTLGWVGERDFYVGRGFIVGWWGVASVKGGNHFSSLAGLSDFLCSRV